MDVSKQKSLSLEDGSRIGVIGGGPSGSLFSFFILQMTQRIGIKLSVDIYERRNFTLSGPAACNMCGGVVSESLVQSLYVEGIDLPPDVVQRGIDSFTFHTADETVTLYSPYREMRIATVYRGAGPKGNTKTQWRSFDGYLLGLAEEKGANVNRSRVTDINLVEGMPQIHTKEKPPQAYDFIVGAVGVNTSSLDLFKKLGIGYRQPQTRKTSNIEFELGSNYIDNELGNSMHAFLLNLPKLDFSAIIPKGNYVTMCLIGDEINSEFVDSFIQNPVVMKYLADKREYNSAACHCAPLASLGNGVNTFGDRILLLGDCGTTRLNKDGIGSAYRVAKTAAVTALFRGISKDDFEKGYWPVCQAIRGDNRFGRIIFDIVGFIKRSNFLTRAVMRMARSEQLKRGKERRMSMVLWDMFTGSAPYREVFLRCLHPGFWSLLIWNMFHESGTSNGIPSGEEEIMEKSMLGKEYHAGDVIVRQGEIGESMYVIQSGKAEVIQSKDGKEIRLAILGEKDIFGEMAIFQKESRSATVRAMTNVRVLTVDKRIFLKRVHEDPSFVFSILQKMSQRIRELNTKLTQSSSS